MISPPCKTSLQIWQKNTMRTCRYGKRRGERSSRDDIKPSAGRRRPPQRASPEPKPEPPPQSLRLHPSNAEASASAEPDRRVAPLTVAQLGAATLLPRRAARRGHGPLEALPLSLSFVRSLRSLDISTHSVRNLHCGLQISQLLSWMAGHHTAAPPPPPPSTSSSARFDPQCSSLPVHPSFDTACRYMVHRCEMRAKESDLPYECVESGRLADSRSGCLNGQQECLRFFSPLGRPTATGDKQTTQFGQEWRGGMADRRSLKLNPLFLFPHIGTTI